MLSMVIITANTKSLCSIVYEIYVLAVHYIYILVCVLFPTVSSWAPDNGRSNRYNTEQKRAKIGTSKLDFLN